MKIRFHLNADGDDDENDVIIPRSLKYYCWSVLESSEATEEQKLTVTALYLYGEAAKTFYNEL